ncbi:MAG: polysaccharide pyruvyl transferase family protein [Eubacterium sp.]
MRYGLITIHNTKNYGSLLQAYSTYKAIESLGVEIELIDYSNKSIASREIPISMRPVRSLKDIVRRLMWGKYEEKKYKGVIEFLENNTKMSPPYNIDNIKDANSRYDGFISGSDIIWGTKITGGDYSYFLDFAKDEKRKIAFSSSVGTAWTDEEKKVIKPLLNRYNAISVREQQAAEWVMELTGKQVTVTCDPTMLMEPDYWAEYVLDDYAPKEKYVLIYAVNPDRKNITDGIAYAKKHGLKAYFVNFYSKIKGTKTIRPVTMQQWITLFACAEVVFSASYHGLLFSMYFKKPVFFYNRGEKSRMISLSKELQIEHREGIDDNVEKDKPINYEFIHKQLEQKRKLSWDILKKVFCVNSQEK